MPPLLRCILIVVMTAGVLLCGTRVRIVVSVADGEAREVAEVRDDRAGQAAPAVRTGPVAAVAEGGCCGPGCCCAEAGTACGCHPKPRADAPTAPTSDDDRTVLLNAPCRVGPRPCAGLTVIETAPVLQWAARPVIAAGDAPAFARPAIGADIAPDGTPAPPEPPPPRPLSARPRPLI